MTVSRFYDPAPVFWDLLAIAPAAGGSLTFYERGTTTPKNTWSDEAMTIPNANPLPLDSAGRAAVNIWYDGAYTVVLKSSAAAVISTRDINSSTDAGLTIPSLVSGQFLTNDGIQLIWQALREIPDPTGSSGKVLGTDGTTMFWTPQPTIPTFPVSNTATSMKVGTMLMQAGSDLAPASGTRQTTKATVFPTAYDSTALIVLIQPTNIATSGQQIAVPSVLSKSTTGFSVQFDSDDFAQANATFTSSVTFDWQAWGIKA